MKHFDKLTVFRSLVTALIGPLFLLSLVHIAKAEIASKAAEASAEDKYLTDCASLKSKRFSDTTTKLGAIFDFQFKSQLRLYPEHATYLGYKEGQDHFTDLSENAFEKRERGAKCLLELVQTVTRAELTKASDRLNYDLFLKEATDSVEEGQFPSRYLQLDQMNSLHGSLIHLLETMPQSSADEFKDILARLMHTPEKVTQYRALLEKGLKNGVTPPQETLRAVPAQFDSILSLDESRNPLLKIFHARPSNIANEDWVRIKSRAFALIKSEVIPSLKELRDFIAETYIPGARKQIAFTTLPNGQKWYAYLVKEHTTTDLTPEQIHKIGLNETERIHAEMIKVVEAAKWKKGLPAYFRFMREDAKFFFKTREQLLTGYRDIAKRIDPGLALLFGKLPRLPYGIKSAPEALESSAPTGQYNDGSIRAGRPGWFIANTYNLKARPKWEMEALTLHEAVPGHHLQVSLSQELEDVPEFRRESFYTAYVEGWGLYAESLGDELGLFRETETKMGALTYEMWRANRLVVDTGIHYYGWSKEKAIAFMKDNMPKPEADIRVEVDRYIVNPGQALSYKIGQMKFQELKALARKELGTAFDVRRFHDAVLGDGALPLDILEKRMNEWLAQEKNLSKN